MRFPAMSCSAFVFHKPGHELHSIFTKAVNINYLGKLLVFRKKKKGGGGDGGEYFF